MNAVTIIGGGLAGLTLGVALRQRGAPVTVFEAGHYPRHRVCGEFISGRGRAVLARHGLEQKLIAVGAVEARTAAFFSPRGTAQMASLPEPALCVSRFALDNLLAAEFRALGGDLREHQRCQESNGEGIVRASGRQTQATEDGWRWFGLKVHARNVTLAADLEVHLTPGGYVGLCRLNPGTVNVCGLFRARTPIPDLAQSWRSWLQGGEGSELSRRLAAAEFCEDTFCSVAGLALKPRRSRGRDECRIGDAISMIAPFSGNGMSMAFESAEIAVEPLISFSVNRLPWPDAVKEIASGCDRAFARRLRWSYWVQTALFQPRLSDFLLRLCGRSPFLWRELFALTR